MDFQLYEGLAQSLTDLSVEMGLFSPGVRC